MKQSNPESDRAKAFLNQLEQPSPSLDPRSFGLDGSNPYYNLLHKVAKELRPEFIVELGTCTGGSTSHLAAGKPLTWAGLFCGTGSDLWLERSEPGRNQWK